MPQVRLNNHNETGVLGEDYACKYLKSHGYKVVERNWRFKNHHEIDVVAVSRDGAYVGVEVRSHSTVSTYEPFESIMPQKIARIKRALYLYALQKGLEETHLQVDVISVICSPLEITHFESVDTVYT